MTLRCATGKGWKARGPASSRRAIHPGTAISWDGRVFEVVSARPLSHGGVEYSLAPWRDDLAIRSLERYDAASEADRAAEQQWRAEAPRKRRLAILLSPLLGHLPGPVQEAMEHEVGVRANAMTAISALPLFAVGLVGLLANVARVAGVSLAPLPEPSFPLSIYLFGESAIRRVIVATQSRPAGSIPGTLLYGIASAVLRAAARRS